MQDNGHYSIHRQGQTLIINCIGSWNNYTARQMSQALVVEINKISDQPWAAIFDTTHWQLGTPDIWLPISKLVQWSALHNQRKVAIIYQKKLQLLMLMRTLEPHTSITSMAFSDEASALEWLAEFYEQNGEYSAQR